MKRLISMVIITLFLGTTISFAQNAKPATQEKAKTTTPAKTEAKPAAAPAAAPAEKPAKKAKKHSKEAKTEKAAKPAEVKK
ncbi:MAG: hypothetical protein WCO63_11710 [Bacteroidota bacterium]